MSTVYDWITVGIFAALIVLFLQRSVAEEPQDHLWHYAPPAVGCALANYLGNEGWDLLAVVVLIGVAAYTLMVLKPFTLGTRK